MEIRIATKFLFVSALLAFFCAPSVASAKSLQKPPNNLGLVGYWSFNEGSGTVATDFSGRGNHGTLVGDARWTGGKLGGALLLDGSGDYVTVASVPDLNILDAFTISFWVKPATTHGGMILKKYPTASGGSQWAVYNLSNSLRFYDGSAFQSTGITLTNNIWQQITLTRAVAGGNITPYLNGAPLSSFGAAALIGGSNPLYFGQEEGSYYFNGSMDEVRIYNRALGAGEVAKLYAAGATKFNTTAPTGTNLSSGLVGYWSFDPIVGTLAPDRSGQGNHGTLTNGPISTEGKIGRGLSLLSASDYVEVANTTSLQINQGAVGAWIKTSDSGAGYHGIVVKEFSYGIFLISNVVGIYDWSTGATRSTGVNLADGLWHHVVLTFNSGEANNTKIYIDGAHVLDTTMTVQTHLNENLGIGDSIGNSQNFIGSIDEVRVYNRALSAGEVRALYGLGASKIGASTAITQRGTNLATGLVGHWTFDGQYLSTSTATDSSGSGNHGTLTGANGKPRPALGRLGQALSFDGVDDYVGATGNDNSNFSTSAWVKTSSTDSFDGIVEYSTSLNGRRGIGLANGNVLIVYASTYRLSTGAVVNDGRWHHIIGTYDGTTPIVYVDGVAVSLGAENGGLVGSSASSIVRIGDFTANGYKLNGSIDDVRIYNRALTAGEVQQLYNLGR